MWNSSVTDFTFALILIYFARRISSTIDHLHLVYSAHLSRQVAPTVTNLERYQRYFDFFGRVSYVKWAALVQPSGCGDLYFSLLNKYSILPHLSRANFASRPVARDGVTYNIESIRAIPFTMFLAQMREFTNAYYGTGAAFEYGAKWLDNADGSTITALLRAYVDSLSADASTPAAVYEALLTNDTRVPHLNKLIKQAHDSHFGGKTFADIVELAKSTQLPPNFLPALKQYPNVFQGIDDVAALVMDMSASQTTTLEVLQEMYKKYPPFNYSIQNKETALIIRWKQIIDDYAEHASAEEKALLAETEEEASLAKKWVLSITKQSELQLKMLVRDFHSPELVLLHKIQAKLLKEYMSKYGNAKSQGLHPTKDQQELETHVQMSILAISEALGFAG
jgi:phosphoenolpyruvate carboxylase